MVAPVEVRTSRRYAGFVVPIPTKPLSKAEITVPELPTCKVFLTVAMPVAFISVTPIPPITSRV